ncbi:MAG: hypothetical protein GXO26_05060 [Crenarchaeota archaeon]|nr:hypothetical protein [Thermoproteota archaeon]
MQDYERNRNRIKIEPLEDITHVLSISPINKRLRIIFNKKIQEILEKYHTKIKEGQIVEILLCIDSEGHLDMILIFNNENKNNIQSKI